MRDPHSSSPLIRHGRTRLALTALAILATPIVLGAGAWFWYAYDAFRYCDLGPISAGPERIGAVSYSARHTPHVFGSMGYPNLYLSSQGLDQLVVQPINDVTFVTCALNHEDSRELLKIREVRVDQLQPWLDGYLGANATTAWASDGTTYIPVGGADYLNEDRKVDTESRLLFLSVAWTSVIPDWVDKDALRNPLIIGWLREGVLLETSSPERWLWVSYGEGLTGRMLPNGQCRVASDDGPLCRGSSAGYRAAPVYALLDAGDLDAALKQALRALDNTAEPALRAELAVSLLRALRRPWAPMVKWLGCPRLDAELQDLERGMRGISHLPHTDERAEVGLPLSTSRLQLADALAHLLRTHRCAAEVP